MFTHEPKDYNCPFCAFIGGRDDEYNSQQDIVYQNEFATAFIAPKMWVNNKGHVLVVPNKHYENVYVIPDEKIAEVYKMAKKMAIAIRSTYDCQGTSTRQHNEPAGGQDVWHFHVHIYPRYENDKLYQNHEQAGFVGKEARAPYAERLRQFLQQQKE